MFVRNRGQVRSFLTGLFFISLILVPTNGAFALSVTNHFHIKPLSDNIIQEMQAKQTWTPECPVALDRLRLVQFSYYDFEGNSHDTGEIVVLDAVAEAVKTIFQELYSQKFPIGKARRIEHYNGNDEASMADNNSSAFNYRPITGGGAPSLHSYGVAIDINPVQNPYISQQKTDDQKKGMAEILPAEGGAYLNRTNVRPGMAEHVVAIFRKHGFHIWGGTWNTPIDWQHFQPTRAVAQLLAVMSTDHAALFFKMYAENPQMISKIDANDDRFIKLYHQNPQAFISVFETQTGLHAMDVNAAYEFIRQHVTK